MRTQLNKRIDLIKKESAIKRKEEGAILNKKRN